MKPTTRAYRRPAKRARPIRQPASGYRKKTAVQRLADEIERLTRPSNRANLMAALGKSRSPLEREKARIEGEFREARVAEYQAMRALTKAESATGRIERELLRAVDADRYSPEMVSLEIKLRDAQHEERLRRRALAACRSVRERCEGEWLSYSRF